MKSQSGFGRCYTVTTVTLCILCNNHDSYILHQLIQKISFVASQSTSFLVDYFDPEAITETISET